MFDTPVTLTTLRELMVRIGNRYFGHLQQVLRPCRVIFVPLVIQSSCINYAVESGPRVVLLHVFHCEADARHTEKRIEYFQLIVPHGA